MSFSHCCLIVHIVTRHILTLETLLYVPSERIALSRLPVQKGIHLKTYEINPKCGMLCQCYPYKGYMKNLIIVGISDDKEESWSELEHKVQYMFTSKLGLEGKIEMERVQRMGQHQERGRPRKIMVNLLRLKDKQRILSSAKKLKGTNIFINEDFSGAVLQRRKELWPKVKAARERGDNAILRYDKLVILPKVQQRKDS